MSERLTVSLRLINLRFLAGSPGERLRSSPSSFTDDIGLRRLGGLFQRTGLRAVLESVSAAARRDHDGRLHLDCVHLFGLGGAQEDSIAEVLAVGAADLTPPPGSVEESPALLDEIGPPDGGPAAAGPTCLGSAERIRLPGTASRRFVDSGIRRDRGTPLVDARAEALAPGNQSGETPNV